MGQQDLIDINKDNLYDIIGVQHDATLKEIAKKYKKQALKLHPDKNPDPTAHQKFLKLTQILELLSDESSRNNYDIILKAREAARLRTKQLDCKRRKLKESLEDKEKNANGTLILNAEQKLLDVIKKLQAEGESILQREEEKLRKEFNDKSDFAVADQATLKIKWKCKKKSGDGCSTGYSKHSLLKILQKYGPVSDVIVNPRRIGSALAIFNSIAAAKICMQREKGDESCPLSFRMLHNTDNHDSKSAKIPETTFTENASFSSFPSNAFSQNVTNSPASINLVPPVDRDYESLTLMRLRQAEERKILIKEMEAKEVIEIDDQLNDND